MALQRQANDIDAVQDPLRSRVEVIEVPRPDAEQRYRMILSEMDSLARKIKQPIELDESSALALAEQVHLDMRHTQRAVRHAVAVSLSSGQRMVVLDLPAERRRMRMGFVT